MRLFGYVCWNTILQANIIAGLLLLTTSVTVYAATSTTDSSNNSGGGPPSACIKGSSQATAFDGIPICTSQQNGNIYTDTTGTVTSNTNSTSKSNKTTHQTSMNGYSDIELVRRYLYGKWQISLPTTLSASGLCDMSDSSIPKDSNGNPAFLITKMDSSSSDSSATNYMPQHGDIMVYRAQGRSSGYPCSIATPNGHVAIVDGIDSASAVNSSNAGPPINLYEEGWSNSGKRTEGGACAACWIHVTANTNQPSCTTSQDTSNSGRSGNTTSLAGAPPAVCDGPVAYGVIDGTYAYDNLQLSDHAACADGHYVQLLYSDPKGVTSGSMPSGGFQTESGYGYQCEEFAYRYFFGAHGIRMPPAPVAAAMCQLQSSSDFTVKQPGSYMPVHGDLMVFDGGSRSVPCGLSNAGVGHVAVVDSAQGSTVTLVDQNYVHPNGEPWKNVPQSCAACWIHANKNTGNGGGGTSAPDCAPKFFQEAYSLAIYNTGISGSIDRNGDLMIFERNVLGWIWAAIRDQPEWSPLSFPFLGNHWTPFAPLPPFYPANIYNAVSDPVTIKHPGDERLEIFYLGTDLGCEITHLGSGGCDLHIWHDWQIAPASMTCMPGTSACVHWAGIWELFPDHLIDATATYPRSNVSVINYHGTTKLFYLDKRDGNIWEVDDDDPWKVIGSLGIGRNAEANLTVIVVGNTIHIFYPGLNNGAVPSNGGQVTSDVMYIWHTYSVNGGKWVTPINMGDVVTSNIAAAVNRDGRLEIFYRGAAEELRHMWQLSPGPTGVWNFPTPDSAVKDLRQVLLYDPSMGPLMTSDPVVAKWVQNKDDTNHRQNGVPNTNEGDINSFNGYSAGGKESGKPMQVFWRGSDGFIWTIWKLDDTPAHNGVWSEAQEISHELVTASPITVIPDDNSTLHIFFLEPLSLVVDRFGENLGGVAGAVTALAAYLADPVMSWFYLPINLYETTPDQVNKVWATPTTNHPGSWARNYIFGIINRDPTQQSASSTTSTSCGSPNISKLDTAGLKAIQGFEGTIQGCYDDGFGNNTFGVGHLVTGPNDTCQGVYLCNLKAPQLDQCVQSVWQTDGQKYAQYTVNALKQAGVDLSQVTQEQFDALTDLCYNGGPGAITQLASDIAHGNQNNVAVITADFMAWANPSVLKSRRESDISEYFHCTWKP